MTAFDLLTNGAIASIYAAAARPALKVGHSFSFVLNVARLAAQEADATLTIAPGHELRRATEEEIAAIKDVLTNQTGEPRFGVWEDGPEVKDGNKTTRLKIPQNEWRYFVVAFEDATPATLTLERTLCMAPFDLKIGFTLLHQFVPDKKFPTLVYHPGRLGALVRAAGARRLPFFELTSEAAENVRQLYDQYRNYDQTIVSIERFVDQLSDLDALPFESPLLFLGYFAVLEALLTHKPKETDTIDSITRQVKQKMILLNNRWQPPIDYSHFQGGPDVIWKKMYHYRSDIAHGADPDFKKDLKLLVSADHALKLLKETVKAVLRQTLIEPRLMVDLRNC